MRREEAERIVWQALVRCSKKVYERLSDEEKRMVDEAVKEAAGNTSQPFLFSLWTTVLS